MNKPTTADLAAKFFVGSPLVKAAEELLAFMIIQRECKKVVDAYSLKILLSGSYPPDSKWSNLGVVLSNPITKLSDTWALSESDAKIYFRLVDVARLESGLTVLKNECCPALEAETAVRNAKLALVAIFAEEVPYFASLKDGVMVLDIQERLIDLILNQASSFCRPAPEVLGDLVTKHGHTVLHGLTNSHITQEAIQQI